MSLTPGSRSSRRLVAGVVLTASLVAIPATATAASGTTSVTLGGAASRSLKAQGVKFSATKPAKATSKRLTFTVSGGSVAAKTATLTHGGKLRLKVGKRSVTLSKFQVRLGGKSPRVTARLGRSTVTFLTLKAAKKRPATFNRGAATARITSATATIPASTAKRLRTALKLKRSPAGRLGTITVKANVSKPKPPAVKPPVVAPPVVKPPVVAPPVVKPPVVKPPVVVPPVVVPPVPPTACPTPAATPASTGSSDWSLKVAWVKYLLNPMWSEPKGIEATGGATQVDSENRYCWRFAATTSQVLPDGSLEIEHEGTLRFFMAAHRIDTEITDPTFVIAADGLSAKVIASGQSVSQGAPDNPPEAFVDAHILDLDLTGLTPTYSSDLSSKTWFRAPARVAADAGAAAIMGYPEGDEFGAFDITAPVDRSSSASLTWNQIKAYDTSAPAGTQRTWLGYATNNVGPFSSEGSMAPSGDATGDTVVPTSASSASYQTLFPGRASSYAHVGANGAVTFSGTLTFSSTKTAHEFTSRITAPRVEFAVPFDHDNNAGTPEVASTLLYASGEYCQPGCVPFDGSVPMFLLDTAADPPVENADGTVTFTGTPTLVAHNLAFPSIYPVGAGPDRTPNTFGSFTLRLPKAVG